MAAGRGPLTGQSILVLEDEPLLARELNFILHDAGASVYVATDEETALRAIEVLGTSAAVLDINLGRKDCSAVCGRLSDGSIPFLFYTGEARRDIMLRWPNTRQQAEDHRHIGGPHDSRRAAKQSSAAGKAGQYLSHTLNGSVAQCG